MDARRDALLRSLDTLYAALPRGGWNAPIVEPKGGTSVWLRVTTPDASALVDRARDVGLVVVPGRFFSTEGRDSSSIRIPLTAAPQTIIRCLAVLAELT